MIILLIIGFLFMIWCLFANNPKDSLELQMKCLEEMDRLKEQKKRKESD